MTRGYSAHIKEIGVIMINFNDNQFNFNQTKCDHVFSFILQNDVPVFICESCSTEQIFIGDNKMNNVNSSMLLKVI